MVWYIFSFCSRDQHEGGTGPADGRHLQARPHWRRAVGGDAGQAVRATLPPLPPHLSLHLPCQRPNQANHGSASVLTNLSSAPAQLCSCLRPLSSLFDYIYICNLLLIKNPCAHTSCLQRMLKTQASQDYPRFYFFSLLRILSNAKFFSCNINFGFQKCQNDKLDCEVYFR